MENEFSYNVLKSKYGKRVGNYKGRDVIVRSKYDELGENVYILYDYDNALIVDDYWVASIDLNGALMRRDAKAWAPMQRESTMPTGIEKGINTVVPPGIELGKVDTSLVDSLLASVYDDILTPLMYNE